MNQDLYRETIAVCEKYIKQVDEQNDKIIIVLDDNKEWLETIRTKTKHNHNVKIISDTDEFRSFIHSNGCSKMFININMVEQNGIDLAEELRLNEYFGHLFFTSNQVQSIQDFERIDNLGGVFVLKSKVLKKISYPEES